MLATTSTSASASASATAADLPKTEPSCSTCLIKFDSKELQRQHMKEDWHVCNLKRRIDSLPPLSAATFQEQVLAFNTKKDARRKPSPFDQSCDACGLHYTNQKAWKAHLRSQNHEEKSSQTVFAPLSLNDPSLKTHEEPEPTNDESIFNSSCCLFCNIESASLYSNLKHMSHAHSFFIPDAEYLIDVESFLGYLSVIISDFHECLYCGSEKSTKFAVQEHMRNKGHCKFDLEDEEEKFGEFYDFEGDIDEDEESEARELVEGKEEMILIPDENELRLPSGKILSHRSHVRHSRPHPTNRKASPQQQHPLLTQTEGGEVETETEELPPIVPRPHDRSLALKSRAGTSTSLIGVPELQQRALIATEKKEVAKEMRKRNEYMYWLERGANRQKRFRVKSIGKKQGGLEKRLG